MSNDTSKADKTYVAPPLPNDGLLRGSKDPMWDLNREQPWHRMAAYFFSMGDTVKSVAGKVDRSLPAVHNLLRQPWFQKMVTGLMAERGDKDITKLFHAEQFNNYSVLTELRDNPNTPALLRMKAAQDMLDRSMGRATTRVEVAHETVSDNPVEEYNRLEAENKRLRKELGSAEDIQQ
jgi:hypothetical protein